MMNSSLISNHPARDNSKNDIPYNHAPSNGTTASNNNGSTHHHAPPMSHSKSYNNCYDNIIITTKKKEKDKGSPRRCQSFVGRERSQDHVLMSQNNNNNGHAANNNTTTMNRRAISTSPDVMMRRQVRAVTMPHRQQFRLPTTIPTTTIHDKVWRWLQRPKHVAFLAIAVTLLISARSLIQTYDSTTALSDNNNNHNNNIPRENHHHHQQHRDDINNNNIDNNRVIATHQQEEINSLVSNKEGILETSSKNDNNNDNIPTTSATNENDNDNSNKKSSFPAINLRGAPPIAYAFLLAGIPPATAPAKGSLLSNAKAMRDAPSRDAYRGLLYNILVSIQILKEAGSRADFIVFCQVASPFHEELAERDAQLLEAVGARILYIPPMTSYVNEFSTVVLEKFRLLELTFYSRITYLDADVMPYCNLDYLMDLSLTGILQDNVLVSIDRTPASGSLFVLTPGPGRFQQILQPLVKWPFKSFSFSPGRGWGVKIMGGEDDDPWQSLSGDSGQEWDFEGADSDQGLLFHYTKYMHGNVTLINGDNLTHYQNGKRVTATDNDNSDNSLRQHSCLPKEHEKTIGNQYYSKDSLRQRTTSTSVAPYRDFAQWRYNQVKPWHYPKTPVEVADTNQITSSRKFWFYMLRRLAVSHPPLQDELHLKPAPLRDESDLHKGEKYNDYDQANWQYVPNRKWKDLNPVWATKVQSLQQWALRIVNATAISFPWEPPVLQQDPIKNDKDENNNNNVLVKMREKCSCLSNTISTDPCSMATSSQPLSTWLDRRVPYYISKQRPLCPDALKHPMHVLVPFYGETSQTQQGMESTLCSVACQDYPPSKVHVLLYAADADSSALEEFSQSNDIPLLAHSPPTSVEDETSATRHVKTALQQQQSSQNIVAIQSKEALPRAGINYWALKFVKSMAKPNDLVMLLHGGDTMYGEQALQQINQAYLKWPIWTAFGSYYQSNQPDLITPASIGYKYKEGQRAFRPRRDQPSWNLHFSSKPFSFKAHMLDVISVQDFSVDDRKNFLGNEIGSAVDQGYICRILEASGAARIGAIMEPLYHSNSATEGNGQLLISHLRAFQPTPLKELPIHVVMLWRGENERFFLLREQLTWLQEQSAAQKLQLHLHILTTKSDESKQKEVNGVLADFAAKQQQGAQGFIPIKFTVSHLKSTEGQKYGQWARFHYVQELKEREAMERVVFMSDNQYWMPDFVESLLQTQKPGTLATWHGKRFSKDVTTARAGYERSEVQWKHIVRRNKNELDTFTHGSLDGASYDANLWLLGLVTNPEEIFGATQADDIMTTSVSTNELDELWASYIVDALLGWEIRRADKSIPIELDQTESKLVQNKIFPLLPPGAGSKLLELHRQLPSRGDDDKGRLWAFDEHKHNLLRSLQSKLHWNALRPSSLPSQSLERPNFVAPLTASSSSQQRMLRRKGKKKTKKRAFVCVTGQFDRLELQNKIEYIFKPLQRDGYTTHAALVLTGEKALFTNKDGKPEFVPHYTEFSQAEEDLKANGIRLVSQNGTYSRITDPPVDDEYTRQLHRTQRWQRTRAEQEERAKNHGRIFESYLRCLHSAEEAASARNQDISTYYDVFLRIRDDAGLNRPLSGMGPRPWPGAPTGGVMHDAVPPPPNSVIVTECRNWHGMNDRFAIVSPDIAREYFTKPYSILAQHKFVDPNIVRNPETLLLNAYTTSKIHVLGHAEMKRVNRVVKQPNGESKFYQDDKWSAGCPSPYKYMHRQFELYGWYL